MAGTRMTSGLVGDTGALAGEAAEGDRFSPQWVSPAVVFLAHELPRER
ncbi:MAG: hypothetical protein M5U19_17900 [Microthrixaceae bacterium]|nr:hypothetical protein [Microthrixaceae bacterium]